MEARKFKHIHVVTPDWLWSCAERWERVEERLYPLNTDCAPTSRKPPAHCTSPDLALQLAIAGHSREDQEASVPVYDRVTGKRIFRGKSKEEKPTAPSSSSYNADDALEEVIYSLNYLLCVFFPMC